MDSMIKLASMGKELSIGAGLTYEYLMMAAVHYEYASADWD